MGAKVNKTIRKEVLVDSKSNNLSDCILKVVKSLHISPIFMNFVTKKLSEIKIAFGIFGLASKMGQ